MAPPARMFEARRLHQRLPEELEMTREVIAIAALLAASAGPARADAGKLRDAFRRVSASVVIVRTIEKLARRLRPT